MKRLFILIFLVCICFVISAHRHAFCYPAFSNSSVHKAKGSHFSRSNCPNNEIELGYQFSQIHSIGNNFKKLVCGIPSFHSAFNYHFYYRVKGIISLNTFFIPTSRLLIFPFHNFW